MAKAQQVIAECVLTELDLGMTFLDVAENARDRKHAQQSIRNAITALRAADRFLSEIPPDFKSEAIQQRRQRLFERLRAIIHADDSGDSA